MGLWDEYVKDYERHLTAKERRDPRIRNLVRAMADHELAVAAGNRGQQRDIEKRMDRLVKKIGYNPLA